MDRLLVFDYLTDGAGNYLINGDGDYIINSTAEYPLDMAAAGVASYRGRPRRVNSFSVLANDDLSDWTLIINQYDLVGRYPSQAIALGALVGCFIHANADQDGLEFMISDMIQKGIGQIDADENIVSSVVNGLNVDVTIDKINTNGVATLALGYQQGTNPDLTGAPIAAVAGITALDGESQTDSFPYSSITENNYYRPILFNVIGNEIISVGPAVVKDEVDPTGLSVKVGTINDEDGTVVAAWDGTEYIGSARAWPIWASEDWPVGITPSYAYAWKYILNEDAPVSIGSSTQTLDIGLVPTLGDTLQLICDVTAYVGGRIVGPETSPTTNVDITNLVQEDVRYIRLFTDLGRTNDVTDNPPADTLVYAYAYSDPAGTQLITDDVVFTGPDDSNDYDASWMDSSTEVLPSARWINADRENASGTYKIGVFAKHLVGVQSVKIYALKHTSSTTTQDQTEDWTLVNTITSETSHTYRGHSVSGYWADYTVPAASGAGSDLYKFKAEITSLPYPGHPSGSTRTLDGSQSFVQPSLGDATYNDVGILKSPGWGSYGAIYGTLSITNGRFIAGDGEPFDGQYLHTAVVGRPYRGEIFVDFATGDDTTGTGSPASPYKTVSRAIEANETYTTSYDYILVDGDHRLRTDISINSSIWIDQQNGVGGRFWAASGFQMAQIKAQNPGQARIIGLCDASGNPVMSSTGIQFGDVEINGVVFYGDDELNGTWEDPGSPRVFASMTNSSLILDGCSVENRWDYSAVGGTTLRNPSQTASVPDTKKGIFAYNIDITRGNNGLGATVGINHTYDELIEDAVAAQLSIDYTISKCDNARLPGFYYDYSNGGDWQWTNNSGTLSGALANLVDYQNNPVAPGPQVWLSLSITAAGVMELEVNSGEGSTISRDFNSFNITANGNTYRIYTTETSVTAGATDIVTWDGSHRQNALLLNLYNDLISDGAATADNFLRGGTPHPDIIQVYAHGTGLVENWISSGIDASDPNNVAQGLFLGDHDTTKNCYFGDVSINNLGNGTGQDAYGKGVTLYNLYWSTVQEGCLFERVSATGGWYRGTETPLNSVMRNCTFLTYSATSPDGPRDDSATNDQNSINDYVKRSGLRDYWYGQDEYPIESGYPSLGFMFPNADGPRTGGPGGDAYLDDLGPSLDPGWLSAQADGTKLRYEVDGSNGLPQKGPADIHWSADTTPSGWYTDPVITGIVYEPNNSLTLTTPPVAYGSPVPSTVSWEWHLDGIGTGNTTATYSIVEADVDKELSIVYTATDGTGTPDLVVTDVLGTIVEPGGADWTDAFASGAYVGHYEAYPAAAITDRKNATYVSPYIQTYTQGMDFRRATGGDTLSYNDAGRSDMYLNGPQTWTYVVGYVEGFGWQKATFTAGQHWASFPPLTFPGADFNGPLQVGGIEMMCYALFLTDPGDVSTWTDFTSQASAGGLRQSMVVEVSDLVGVSQTLVSSTGDEIIKSDKPQLASTPRAPRLWNGAEALNAGATSNSGDQSWGSYSFGTAAESVAWWSTFDARVRVNGGQWFPLTGDTPGEIDTTYAFTNYNDLNQTSARLKWDTNDVWPTLALGDTLEFEVYDSGFMPNTPRAV